MLRSRIVFKENWLKLGFACLFILSYLTKKKKRILFFYNVVLVVWFGYVMSTPSPSLMIKCCRTVFWESIWVEGVFSLVEKIIFF